MSLDPMEPQGTRPGLTVPGSEYKFKHPQITLNNVEYHVSSL